MTRVGSIEEAPTQSRVGPIESVATTAATLPATAVVPAPDAVKPPAAAAAAPVAPIRSAKSQDTDAVLHLIRASGQQTREGPLRPISLRMRDLACMSDEESDGTATDAMKATPAFPGSSSGNPLSQAKLQSLLMQVVGQVASYNERMTQENDARKAIIKVLVSHIQNQRDNLKRSESILNEYRASLSKDPQ